MIKKTFSITDNKHLSMKIKTSIVSLFSLIYLAGCSVFSPITTQNSTPKQLTKQVDILLTGGTVFTGDYSLANAKAQLLDIAICQQVICGVFRTGTAQYLHAKKTIDVTGKIVSPGFIDPHTHSLAELMSDDKNSNLNYLTQGVTTVVNGNDGGGSYQIKATTEQLMKNGIGTNTALLVGHGSIRNKVMGRAKRFATPAELKEMSLLLDKAMQEGAIGFSTGLYYVPQNYANTAEVITLAKVASKYHGIYDTHIRDESTFNIGFLNAIDEAIHIATAANIHLHLAHIKALGVDVWGQSKQAIEKIETAQHNGVSISADQYPWLASGTKLRSAVMPKWVMADSTQAFYSRLNQADLQSRIRAEISENIRRRGGPTSLRVTAFSDQSLVGLNLLQIADKYRTDPISAAIKLVQLGEVRVASFNMSTKDVEAFMVKPWVVTSSDGTDGHPRKYASFPQKYHQYVVNKQTISLADFIYRSSTQTAQILNLKNRGILRNSYQADIVVFDPKNYAPKADFAHWNRVSTGVEQLLVNGELVIEQGKYLNILSGQVVH